MFLLINNNNKYKNVVFRIRTKHFSVNKKVNLNMLNSFDKSIFHSSDKTIN